MEICVAPLYRSSNKLERLSVHCFTTLHMHVQQNLDLRSHELDTTGLDDAVCVIGDIFRSNTLKIELTTNTKEEHKGNVKTKTQEILGSPQNSLEFFRIPMNSKQTRRKS